MLKSLVIAALMFLTAGQTANSSLRQMRMTPAEIAANGAGEEQTGGAGSAAGQRRGAVGGSDAAGDYIMNPYMLPPHNHPAPSSPQKHQDHLHYDAQGTSFLKPLDYSGAQK